MLARSSPPLKATACKPYKHLLLRAIANGMRAITRLQLPKAAADFLAACHHESAAWDNAVQRTGFVAVKDTLVAMSGKYKNCMYCERSEATDVEHFKPKSKFKAEIFTWLNLLYCCTPCNRHKGTQFPIDASGAALLIDPSKEDPWQYLTFDSETGNIDPLFVLGLNDYAPKGVETVKVLKLNRQRGLEKVYKTNFERLESVMHTSHNDLADVLVKKLIETDDHGLLGWCFSPQGQRQAPFHQLTSRHRLLWKELTT
jgi:uncharacterized protein (TIGR02646 family)